MDVELVGDSGKGAAEGSASTWYGFLPETCVEGLPLESRNCRSATSRLVLGMKYLTICPNEGGYPLPKIIIFVPLLYPLKP